MCRSLGVVIYEMVIGHPPWEYQRPSDSTLDEYFQCIKLIAEPSFQTADQTLSSDLQSLLRCGFTLTAFSLFSR